MLIDLQRLLVRALGSADPAACLREAADLADSGLSAQEAQWLRSAAADGLQLSRLIVRKLRIQRLVAGDREAARLLAADPAAFAACFRAYEAAVPPRAVFASEEAAAFRARR